MKIIGLYRYTNSDGSISITPEKRAKTDIENQYRLIADKGKLITDGKKTYYCIDTNNIEQFTEIPIDPTPEPETDLTVADTLKMLNDLGVDTNDKNETSAREGIKEWINPKESQKPYNKNDKCYYKEQFWVSTIDNNISEPGGFANTWINI